MKKKNLLLGVAATFVFSMAFMLNVYADEPKCTDITDASELTTAIAQCSSSNITLKKNASISTETLLTVSSDVTLDLNGGTITRSGKTGNTVFNVTNNHTFTINDSVGGGKIVYNGEGAGPTTAITVSDNSTLTVNAGTLIGDGGIGIWGAGATVNFKGGTIQATENAINSNGSHASNSTINIMGGTINSLKGAVVYMPQSGNLKISGGEMTGYVGVVSRAGAVDITGGTITATGTDSVQIGDAKDVKFPGGVAVIVDNKTPGYGNDTAKATIGGKAVINATNEDPVLAYSSDNPSEEITIESGAKFIGTEPDATYLGDLVVGPNGVVMTEAEAERLANQENTNQSDENTTSNTVINKVIDKTKLDDVPKTGIIYSALSFMNYLR